VAKQKCGRRRHRRVKITRRYKAKLNFTPTWEGAIKNWAAKHIRENLWRCDSIHGFDDLMQDAYLWFVKICERYPRVNDPRHFMSLFKTTLRNKLHDHARYMQRKRVLHEDTDSDVSECFAERVGELTNGGFLSALLARAPEQVKRALTLVTQNPAILNADPHEYHRENLNMRVSRVLGLHNFRLDAELRQLLTA
jgi:hypothetical protein